MLEVLVALLAFVLIIWAAKRGFPLGLALIVASLAFGAVSLPPSSLASTLWLALKDPLTLELAAVVALISILGYCSQELGAIKDLLTGLRKALRDARAVLALTPALIGLMPMPGGALLSAPFVRSQGAPLRVARELGAFINHWFRHVFYLVFPLFPGLILAAELSGVGIYLLALIQLPLFLLAVAIGALALTRIRSSRMRPLGGRLGGSMLNLLPILVVLGTNLLLGVKLVFALPAGILALFAIKKVNPAKGLRMVGKGVYWELVLAIVGIMIFRQVVEASGVLEEAVEKFVGLGVPTLATLAVVPFVAGLFTGSEIASIGISFPLILPMLGAEGQALLVSTAYVGAFLGCLISPIHPCVTFCLQYFKPREGGFYKLLVPAIAPVLALSILVSALVV